MTNKTFFDLYNRFPLEVRMKLNETQQNPRWHPEGCVQIHTNLVFNYAKDRFNDIDLMVTALFHDLGKIEKTVYKTNKSGHSYWSSPQHELLCSRYIDAYIGLFDDLELNIEKIREICRWHTLAHLYISGEFKNKTKVKAFEGLTYFEDIIKFAECDTNGKCEL